MIKKVFNWLMSYTDLFIWCAWWVPIVYVIPSLVPHKNFWVIPLLQLWWFITGLFIWVQILNKKTERRQLAQISTDVRRQASELELLHIKLQELHRCVVHSPLTAYEKGCLFKAKRIIEEYRKK